MKRGCATRQFQKGTQADRNSSSPTGLTSNASQISHISGALVRMLLQLVGYVTYLTIY